jgi:hypothetical protein
MDMPATIEGLVTTEVSTGMATGANVAVRALQRVDFNGTSVLATVPLFPSSTANLATEPGNGTLTCPVNTNCASYTLKVPASNPQVGTFDSAGTTYTPPAMGEVQYAINARAFTLTDNQPNCSPSSLLTEMQDGGGNLTVMAGQTITAQMLDFTGCEADSSP